MINFNEIKKEYGAMICRACLNVERGAKLRPEDCIYDSRKAYCAHCKCYKHIVTGLRFSGKMKTLFK